MDECGLQTAQNVFEHGEKASDWQLKKLKSSMSKIFHEAPGKHADYKQYIKVPMPAHRFKSSDWSILFL